jgi:hypothetical protein
MKQRKDNRLLALQVQALYSVPALARIANVTTHMLRRLLQANGVQFIRGGRASFVPLSEIRRKIPSLWESLRFAEQVRAQAGRTGRPAGGGNS